jgi:hypothetical protein
VRHPGKLDGMVCGTAKALAIDVTKNLPKP